MSTHQSGSFDRRSFLQRAAAGVGALCGWRGDDTRALVPHFTPRCTRVLYLHMVGAPSQLDLFDHKPALARWHGQDLPDSVRQGQRITTMTSGQQRLRIQQTNRVFAQHGRCGAWISDLLPFTARCADELAIVRSMHTDAINHEPALNLAQTGTEQLGRPCFGAWRWGRRPGPNATRWRGPTTRRARLRERPPPRARTSEAESGRGG